MAGLTELAVSTAQPLVDLLTVPGDGTTFHAAADPTVHRVFGGQLVGQAMWAAGSSVETGLLPHAVHCSFVSAPNPERPLSYTVDRLRDGRSFAQRSVRVEQAGEVVAVVVVLLCRPQPEPPRQWVHPSADTPDRGATLDEWLDGRVEGRPAWWDAVHPAQLRYPLPPPQLGGSGPSDGIAHCWLRCAEQLPDDPLLNACVLGWGSDLTSFDAASVLHGICPGQDRATLSSMNHQIWLHRHARADDWVHQQQVCTVSASGLVLTTSTWFDDDGGLIATIVQEGLIRMRGLTGQDADR